MLNDDAIVFLNQVQGLARRASGSLEVIARFTSKNNREYVSFGRPGILNSKGNPKRLFSVPQELETRVLNADAVSNVSSLTIY